MNDDLREQQNFKEGDSVTVKPGVKDPDTGANIAGWQGRISTVSVEDGEIMVSILWDSVTLKNIPRSMFEYYEDEGLDWREMYLGGNEVKPASPRDSEEGIEEAIEEIESQTAWLFLGEEGKRIQKVLDGIDPDDEMKILEAWEVHLRKKLRFPFEAEIVELARRGPLPIGSRVTVKGISRHIDDIYGIIVEVAKGHGSYEFPLCDLEAIEKQAKNYRSVKDYVVWYANRF